MIRRLGFVALVLIMVGIVVWLPREDEVWTEVGTSAGEPLAVAFTAAKRAPLAPFVERWELTYPEVGPATQTFVLEIGAPEAARGASKTVAGRLSASSTGDATPFFDRLVLVLGADGEPEPPPPGATAPSSVALRLDLIGEDLSYGPSDVGSIVLAGAFITSPPGEWRAYRVTLGGDAGSECFLGVSERLHAARLLPSTLEDAPAIVAGFRRVLRPTPKRES